MIEINNICKNIDNIVILDNLSIKINKGSIFGLVGTNGAGKTTLIKCIMGIWNPDSGNIKLNDIETSISPLFRQYTAYVSDEINIPGSYTVAESKKLYKLAFDKFDENYFDEINELFKIPMDSRVRDLSKGMGSKLSIMLNLSFKPDYLIMDEPLSGLDPISRKETVKLLFSDASNRGTTILISSHNLSDIERFCDTFAILDEGKIRFTDTIDEVKNKIRKIQAVFPNGVPSNIEKLEDITNISISGRVVRFITSNYNDVMTGQLTSLGASLVETIDTSLDEIFFHVMEGSKNE
jgi:ABC-2 type transport system ATP-binding protein